MEDDFVVIAALQHYAFCPRQFALIHVEQSWNENYFTAKGRLLHERVDSGDVEQRNGLRSERSVLLISYKYRIQGKMDLIEVKKNNEAACYVPVEYKSGKPKTEDWDRIQVCAQALCIEEMRNTKVAEGAIWYWKVRRREPVMIDDKLRNITIDVIKGTHELLISGKTPRPIRDKSRCRACSLIDICQPKTFRRDSSATYIDNLFFCDGVNN